MIASSPPLNLLVNPSAKPVMVNLPSPLQVHWLAKVKADLNRDMVLGVMERV